MGILINFLRGVFAFIFTKAVPKFFLFFGLFFLVAEFTPVLLDIMGIDSWLKSISSLFGSLPSGVLYFMSVLKIGTGLNIVLSAFVVRFIIRRIPLMG